MTGPAPFRPLRPAAAVLAAAALAVAAVAVALLLARPADQESGPVLGAVLDATDRQALALAPLRRGAAAPPADRAVDLADPVAVARVYLAAARSADADDGGATHLRAAAYAVPGSPPAAVGVVVLDPPPPGQVRRATVTGLDLVAADPGDLRRGYRAIVTSVTVPSGAASVAGPPATSTAYVVLARQPDGRWLVAQDVADAVPDADD